MCLKRYHSCISGLFFPFENLDVGVSKLTDTLQLGSGTDPPTMLSFTFFLAIMLVACYVTVGKDQMMTYLLVLKLQIMEFHIGMYNRWMIPIRGIVDLLFNCISAVVYFIIRKCDMFDDQTWGVIAFSIALLPIAIFQYLNTLILLLAACYYKWRDLAELEMVRAFPLYWKSILAKTLILNFFILAFAGDDSVPSGVAGAIIVGCLKSYERDEWVVAICAAYFTYFLLTAYHSIYLFIVGLVSLFPLENASIVEDYNPPKMHLQSGEVLTRWGRFKRFVSRYYKMISALIFILGSSAVLSWHYLLALFLVTVLSFGVDLVYQCYKLRVFAHLFWTGNSGRTLRYQVEGFVLFAAGLYRARSYEDAAIAALNFLRSFTNSTAITEKVYRVMFDNNSRIHLQSGYVSKVNEAFHTIKDMPLTCEVQSLAAQLLALGFFESVGLDVPQQLKNQLRKDYSRSSASPMALVGVLLKLSARLERAVMLYKQTGRLDGFVHTADNYQSFYRRYRDLRDRVQCYDQGSDDDIADISQVVDVILSEAQEIQAQTLRSSDSDKKWMFKFCEEAITFCRKFQLEVGMTKSRTPPFGILIYSPPRYGKSTLVDILHQSFGKRFEKPTHSATKYVRGDQKYWDGFKTSHWCIVMDDLASENPKKQTGIPEQMQDILRIVNAIPFSPEQASVEDKGTRICMADLVIGTTNTRHLNAHIYFQEAGAIMRRFPYIVEPMVKPEFRGADGGLEASKTDGSLDYWHFKVFEHGREKPVRCRDIARLLRFLWRKAAKHRNEGSTIKQGIMNWANELCKHGIPNCDKCKVVGPPSSDVDLETDDDHSNITSSPDSDDEEEEELEFQSLRTQASKFKMIFLTVCSRWWQRWSSLFDCGEQFIDSATVDQMDEARVWSVGRQVEACTLSGPQWKMLGYITILLSTVYAFYRMTKRLSLQGDIGSRPASKNEEESFWKRDEDVLTPVASDTSRCATIDTLTQRVELNVFRIAVSKPGDYENMGVMLGLGGHKFLVNKHVIKDGDSMRVRVPRGNAGVQEVSLKGLDIKCHPTLDLALIELDAMPPRKGLWDYLPEKNLSSINGVMLYPSSTLVEKMQFRSGPVDLEPTIKLMGYSGYLDRQTFKGLCGSPVISKVGSYNLLCGIHSAGVGRKAFLTPITKEALKEFNVPLSDVEPTMLSFNSQDKISLQSLHWKSNIRFQPLAICETYGSLSGFRSSGKSRVGPSLGAQIIEQERGIVSPFYPPVMKGWRPWAIALEPLVAEKPRFDPGDIKWAVSNYLVNFTGLDLSDIMIYDTETAINGVPGLKFVDAINKKSSMGFPWRETKRRHLIESPTEDTPHAVTFNTEVLGRMHQIEQSYMHGNTVSPVFTASLKDEPVSEKKRDMGKTRVFCGAPIDWVLVVRKYMLSFCRFLQINWRHSEMAVGVTAQGPQWACIKSYITRHGADRIVAGDYSAFDKSMPAEIILASFDVLIELARRAGYLPKHLLALKCIANDVAFSTVDYNGDLMRFFGSNPSGHPLTVIVNSIANSLYMRIAYKNITGRADFREKVALLTYGDDNIMSVSRECKTFDHTRVQDFFATVGIKYTMADKESDSVPFIHLDDAEFLKRSWADCEFGVLAPLREESIWKMLCIVTESKEISADEQYMAIIHSANMEWFFHGKERFQREHEFLLGLVEKLDLNYLAELNPLKNWNELKDTFFPQA